MADFANSISASSATPIVFDAAGWLSQFESFGGGFITTDSQTSLCIACHGTTPENQRTAHAMMCELTDAQRAAVIAHIRGRAKPSGTQPELNSVCLQRVSGPAGNAAPSSGLSLGQSEGSHNMDMTHSFTLPSNTERPAGWSAALADYEAARAWSDSLPDDHPQSHAALDAYCEAMDHLIENVRAPSIEALTHKIALSQQRWEAWGRPDQWLVAFQADLAALSAPVLPDSNRADWDAAMARFKAAESFMITSDYSDGSSDIFLARKLELWATPAPDFAALRWKLNDVLEPDDDDDDESPAWRKDLLRQTYADIDRLLGDA